MINGLVTEDGTAFPNATFGARITVGNASINYGQIEAQYGAPAPCFPVVVRKRDPLSPQARGLARSGYALSGRGRTWDFIMYDPQGS